MKKEKQICTFGKQPHEFNKVKRSPDFERAPRPRGGGSQHGKPPKGDTTPAGISSVATNATESTASISWITSEETTCVLHYGTTTAYGSTISAGTGKTSFSVALTGLVVNTTYHFKVVATDLAGNISNSPDYSFVTIATPIKVIYIELYGATVSGTMWNTNGTIIAGHSGLSETEIDEFMIRVQSHFADYNVLVTNDLALYNATPASMKARVIVTESNEWYGNNAGGVAYINSWDWYDGTPAWVFSKLLGYSVHNIGEAAAHETGHIMGCRHQSTCTNGTVTSEYNWGDGVTAPVMGASYNVPSGDWWVGPTPLGCSTLQDDNAIITSKLGLKP